MLEIFINSSSTSIIFTCVCSFSELSRSNDEEFVKLMCSSTSNKLIQLLSNENRKNEITSLIEYIIYTFVGFSSINSDNYGITLINKGLLIEIYRVLVVAFRQYKINEGYDENDVISRVLTIVKNIVSIGSNKSYKKIYNSGLLSLIINIFKYMISVEDSKDDIVTKIGYIISIFQSIINKGDINTVNEMIHLGIFDLVNYTIRMIDYNNIVESSIYIYDDILGNSEAQEINNSIDSHKYFQMFINKSCIEQIEYVLNNSDDVSLIRLCKDFIKEHYPKCRKYSSKAAYIVIPNNSTGNIIKEETSTQEKIKVINPSFTSIKKHYEESAHIINIMKFSFLLPIISFRFSQLSVEISEPKLSYSLEMLKDREEIIININKILIDICLAIKGLNSVNLIHGSLSPTNILFDKDFNLFIDDYCLYNLRSDILLPLTTYSYLPPEVILKKEINKTSDMFSVGCIMYFILNGKSLNDGIEKYRIKNLYSDKDELNIDIKNTNYQFLFNSLTQINPFKRISCDNLCDSLNKMDVDSRFNDRIEKTIPLNILLNNNVYYFKNRHYLFRYNRKLLKMLCDVYNESGELKQCLFLLHKMWNCYSFCDKYEIQYLNDLIYKNIEFKSVFESNIFKNSEECYMMKLKSLNISDKYFEDLMNNIDSIKGVRLLDISENRITNSSLQSLYNKLSLLTHLQTLYINNNMIDECGKSSLYRHLFEFQSKYKLNIKLVI